MIVFTNSPWNNYVQCDAFGSATAGYYKIYNDGAGLGNIVEFLPPYTVVGGGAATPGIYDFYSLTTTQDVTKLNIKGWGAKKSIIIPFVESSGGSAGVGNRGFDIDGVGETAHSFATVPFDAIQLYELRVWAKSNVAEADAMNANLVFYGAADNEVYSTNGFSDANRASASTNFANDDIIYWTTLGSSLSAWKAGDSIDIRLIGAAADGANCATDCAVRSVEIFYI